MRLISLDAKPFHHMPYQPVIIASDRITAIFLRPEIACNTEFLRIVKLHAGRVVRHPLGNRNMRLKAFAPFPVKIDKTAHGVQKSPGNGQPKPKPSRKTVAARIRLIKIIIHLPNLHIRHADAGVKNIDYQIDSVAFPSELHTDVNAALFRKFNRILHQNFKYMRNLLRIPDKDCRQLRVNIEHHLQLAAAILHSHNGKHVVQHGSKTVLLFYRH